MALSANTVWEVRTTGADTNGGGFVAGASGTDYSQQATAQYALTGLTTAAADAVILTASAAADMVGNTIQITSGTNFTVGFYEILSVSVGVSITVDRNCTTAAGAAGVGNIGGSLATIGTPLNSVAVAGNTVWVKATATYTITSTINVVSAGDTTNGPITITGYTTTRGAQDGRPLVTTATNSTPIFTLPGTDYVVFRYLHLTNTAAARARGIDNDTGDSAYVKVEDCVIDGMSVGIGASFQLSHLSIVGTEIKNCTSHGIASGIAGSLTIDGCDIHDNGGSGAVAGYSCLLYARRSIFDTNAGRGIYWESSGGYNEFLDVIDCLFVDNGSAGLQSAESSGTVRLHLVDSIFINNGTYGVALALTANVTWCYSRGNRNNFYGSGSMANTSGAYTGWSAGIGDQSVSADPFVNRAGRDFSPNTTAGGGAVLRAAGFPGAFPGGTTTSYLDGGPVQHQDSGGGGGGMHLVGSGGLVS